MARYVDTFNRGGGNAVSGFQSPSVPSAKPAGGINPKFFVPAPASHAEQLVVEEKQNASTTYENASSSPPNDSFHSPTPSSSMAAMQRFGSMSNIYNKGANDSSFALNSRRTASWGGSLNDSMSPPNRTQQPPGEPLGMRPPSFRQSDTSLADSSVSGGSFGEELQEVELWYPQGVHSKFIHTARACAIHRLSAACDGDLQIFYPSVFLLLFDSPFFYFCGTQFSNYMFRVFTIVF